MVGERLREARGALSLSLADVAQRADISAATLSRIENNKQGLELGLFLILAKILHVSPAEVLKGSAEGPTADPLVARIAALPVAERTKLWSELAAARRAQRGLRNPGGRNLGQKVEELTAQIEYLREEIEVVRAKTRRR